MSLLRCSRCVMPNTRPDTPFINGVCAACLSYERRPTIDWDERKAQLLQLLDRHEGRVLVPSSGGKDSTYQVLTLLELGADVTIVTARTCHLTPIGRANIDNLARYARTIEVVPNMTVRAKLNRLGLELVGDISHPEHMAIFTTPFHVAKQTGHTLLVYGECPNREYGGPLGSEESMQLTARWRSEYGGFLGLRPDDLVGLNGITDRDMDDYRMPDVTGIEAHFLGQYIGPWDSRKNAKVATGAGMRLCGDPIKPSSPCTANWWIEENLDNAQTGLHDYFMWLKYGFGRACQQVSVDMRRQRAVYESGPRDQTATDTWFSYRYAMKSLVEERDGLFPEFYAGVHISQVLGHIGMTREQLKAIEERFKNCDILGERP